MSDALDQLGVQFAADHAAKKQDEARADAPAPKPAEPKKTAGSRQLTKFRKEIMAGATLEQAAEKAAIPLEEARLTAEDEPELKAKLAELAQKGQESADESSAPAASNSAENQPEPAPASTAPAEVPAAPGEDAETVFDRRLERLSRIVEEAEFDTGTALGDLRDCILDLFKHRPKVWSAMSQSEQQDTVRAVEKLGQQIMRKMVLVIAQDESESIQGTLDPKFSVKGDTIELKVKVDHIDGDVLLLAYQLADHKVVLVSADDKRFSSQRRDVPTDPDQIPMTFADDKPKAPRAIESAPPAAPAPADDSDLADVAEGQTEKAAVETAVDAAEEVPGVNGAAYGTSGYKGDAPPEKPAEEQAVALVGVFDTARGEWLTDEEGGDDAWSADASQAKTWPYEQAKEIADAFEAPDEVIAKPLP